MMTLLQAVAAKARHAVGSDEWVHYYYELFGALASFSAFVGIVALLVDGKWWLWTTYKSRPYLSLCPLMMISIPPSPAPDLFTTPTPFLPPVSSPGPLSLPFPITASSPSPSPAPEPAPEPVQVPAVVKATRAVAGLSSAQSQQQHQKKKKTQKKKAGESKPPWRI